MALGAVKILRKSYSDGLGIVIADIVGSSSYTTGGDAITAATLGLPSGATIYGVSIMAGANTVGSPLLVWDPAGTIRAYGTAAGATGLTECTAAGNFSTHTYRVLVLCDKIG
jgi:hypothetical protein